MKIHELKEGLEGLEQTIEEPSNPKDFVAFDIPLFIRILEWAREDAKSDLDVHQFTENAITLSSEEERILTMEDYESLLAGTNKKQETEY